MIEITINTFNLLRKKTFQISLKNISKLEVYLESSDIYS